MASGLLQAGRNRVTVLADALECPADIDYARACKAEKRARERLQFQGEGMDLDLDRALRALARAVNRRKLAKELGHVSRKDSTT